MRAFPTVAFDLVVALLISLMLAGPAAAWGPVGHQVIALFAWDSLVDSTRLKIVQLMQQAPPEAHLASLFPTDSSPLADRQLDFFRIAATWPDLIRSLTPADRHAFHRPPWHFRDFFWKRAGGQVVDLSAQFPTPAENAIERLAFFKILLADPSKPAPDRAVVAGDLETDKSNPGRQNRAGRVQALRRDPYIANAAASGPLTGW